MKNKLFIFIFLSSINFTQADTSATPKLAAAPEEKIHCKDAQEYRENIKRAMYCEKIWLLILAAKKHSDYISPENLAKLHEHFTTFKCNDFPNLLQDISEVEYAREKIKPLEQKENKDLTIEELYRKEGYLTTITTHRIRETYGKLRMCKQANISPEEMAELEESINKELGYYFEIKGENS